MLPQLARSTGCSSCVAKLDRLGWAAGLSFLSHGARIGIRVTDPAALDRVREYLPPGWKPSASPRVDELYSLVVGAEDSRIRRYHLLYAGAARLARSLDLREVLEVLQDDLHYTVAAEARRRLFVRAGVVGWRGRAVVVLGPEGAGTTSLVAALVRAGAAYYSDDFAVFDPRGRVHPHPVPLRLKSENGERPRRLPVEELGGRVGRKPLPVGLILSTQYTPDARWHPRQLSPGQAVLALLEHTPLARMRPAFALEVLGRAADGASGFEGPRAEAEELAQALLRHPGKGAKLRLAAPVSPVR